MTQSSGSLFVGIDWATESHQVLIQDDQGKVLGERQVRHSAAGLAELCDWLLSFGRPVSEVHVGIETPHGAVVETLLERSFPVFSINPKQLDRFRDRFSMAGAKDDRRDALVLADSLRTDAHCFRRVQVESADLLELREWSRMTEDLVQERVRLTNRMREQLLRYYPQFLQVNTDLGAEWVLDLWRRFPTPERIAKARRSVVASILKRHRVRRLDADQVLELLQQPALVLAPGTIAAACAHLELLLDRLRVVHDQLRRCRTELRQRIHGLAATEDPEPKGEQRDVTILLSMPGIGSTVLATLLAEAGRLVRERDYHGLRAFTGVAPVTQRSGKHRPFVLMRRACNPRLRNALYHWARVATQRDPTSKSRYATLRARGHSHGRALRSIGDRLLYVLTAMLKTQTTYRAPAA
jgi:transposase